MDFYLTSPYGDSRALKLDIWRYFVTLEEYEHKFLSELTDNYEGGQRWHDYVIDCYREYMDSVAEQELEMESNQL